MAEEGAWLDRGQEEQGETGEITDREGKSRTSSIIKNEGRAVTAIEEAEGTGIASTKGGGKEEEYM